LLGEGLCSGVSMPKELVAVSPRTPILREYKDNPLKPNQVRVRSTLSAVKHGTTLAIYRGETPFEEKTYDVNLHLFLPKDFGKGWKPTFPMSLGNMTVGIVTEVGDDVERFKVGDRVYGYLPVRETHTVSEDEIKNASPELSDEEIVCIDPAAVALMAVREGHVRLGDKVAIFGLGAIGLMAVQMAKLSGATLIIGVDPIEMRRSLAKAYGADVLIDPTVCDSGLEVRKATDLKGVDVSIESSGSHRALHHAIRGTSYGGTIVPVSWYHGEPAGLNLGEEWHFNRQVMVSGARVESEPYREHPRWDRDRIYETVIKLFEEERITVDGLLHPIVKLEEAAEAFRKIDERPWETIKLAIRYG